MPSEERRRRRKKSERNHRSALRIEQFVYGPEPGPSVVSASLHDVTLALQAQEPDLTWESVADGVIPVMPRIRPYPDGFPAPLRVVVEPGVAVGYAVDIGPAFMGIAPDLIRSWGVPLADVQARALANTISRASRIDRSSIYDGSMDGTRTRWLQSGQSIGSVLILVPDELRRIFGPEPAFFITPMRDLIIGFPPDVDRELAAWLWLEVASQDPNCLGPTGYRFDGHAVRPESLDGFVGGAFDVGDLASRAYVA